MQPIDPLLPPASTPVELPLVVPILAETVHIEKERVETGRVRLHKTVHVESQTVDVQQQQVQVQRVAVNRYVDEVPSVRYEGETMIVPVVREELVVTKRLLLVEEVHVHQQTVTTHSSQTVELQREELHYERIMTLPTPPIPSPES
jgi:uncharacterized protein (TIGR02271 family)